jgi:reverse gyrase
MIKAIYANLCPVCGEDLTVEEALEGLCKKKGYRTCRFKEDKLVEEFFEFFRKIIGEPRSIQKFWARRILRGESFAAVAPTGIGKTSFGSAVALFLALKGKKSYIILPTTLLVQQVAGDLVEYCKRFGINASLNGDEGKVRILYFHGRLKKDEKEKFFELLSSGSFDILVTTTQFLSKHFGTLKGMTFDFIFVDDVDSVLKASKNVDRILTLLGFYYKDGKWQGKAKGCLMVSTATAKKGQKVRLFRELLNFDVGTSTHAVRNIEDVAVNSEDIDLLCGILKKMGTGGIIYARNTEEAERLYEILKRRDLKVGIVTAGKKKDYELFEKGEIDYLVGTAYYYGTLVRGLDLPERIRFAVFFGAPVFRVRVEDIDTASVGIIKTLALIFRTNEDVKKFIPYLSVIDRRENQLNELRRILKGLLEKGEIEEKDVVVRKGEIIFPDVRTYIQGSGRTSRLFAGGITKGASFLFEKDEEILKAFVERAKYFDVEFKSLDDVDFESLIKEINETREKFKRKTEFDVIKPTLFIVESPTKAKQISRFFGQPSIKVFSSDEGLELVAYEVPTAEHVLLVTACIGHITDLITNKGFHGVLVNGRFVPIYASIKRCRECGYQFTEEREDCPRCGSSNIDDSKRRINALRKLAHDAELIIIGTDPDSEGEKIAWDLKNLLAGCGEIKRAEFHEVTRRAVTEALKNLRDIDENLVKAQIVRRIEDRWIGFVLSQKLWDVFGDRNLSAGRAQTPVLGWVIDRFNEYKQKKKIAIIRDFDLVLETDKSDLELEIELLEEKEEEKTPLPPYTTDTMLRDANAILKIPAKDAMKLAQDLFEAGLCVTPDTLVMMGDGSIKRICEIEAGEKVVGLNDLHEKVADVLKFWKIPYKGLIREIKLENNYSIKATPDHGLFVYRDGKFGWVSAKNVKEGDYVAVAYNLNVRREKPNLLELLAKLGITDVCVVFKEDSKTFEELRSKIKEIKTSTKYKYLRNRTIPLKYLVEWGVDLKRIASDVESLYRQRGYVKRIPLFELDEKFWYFVGLVMGDGSVRDGKIAIAQKDVDIIKEIVKETFPFIHSWTTRIQVWIANSIIAEILKRLDVRGKLNGIMFSLPEEWINAMIAGYIDTDGCISLMFDKNCGKHNLRILISAKEKEKLEKIGFYLHTIGILNVLHYDKRSEVWDLVISNRSLEVFKQKIAKYLRIKKSRFDEAYEIYKRNHRTSNSDMLPFGELFRMLKFKRGVKNKILKELGIDTWNWNDCECIPREKLKKVVELAEDSDVKRFLIELLNANVTWVRVKGVEDRRYEGYVYDITTTTSNFFANAVLNHNCTYHRTDSTRVSDVGLRIAKEYLGDEFTPRDWFMEGAHECIRPTRAIPKETLQRLIQEGVIQVEGITWRHLALYDLIFRRFMASQCKSYRVKVARYLIRFDGKEVEEVRTLSAEGKAVELYKWSVWVKKELPTGRIKVKAEVRTVPKAPLFTQSDIVQLMKERGIGRPSTYATIVDRLFMRNYVIERNNRVIPTKRGIEVYKYLASNYGAFVSEERTRLLEEKMDAIERGELDYFKALEELYEEIRQIT